MVVVDDDQINAGSLARQRIWHGDAVNAGVDAETTYVLPKVIVDDDDGIALHSPKHDVEVAIGGVGVYDHIGTGVVVDDE